MFTEIMPVLKDRTICLTIAAVDARTIRVNVIPIRKGNKENDTAESALTTPLTVTAAPEELDREFGAQLAGFTGSLTRLGSNLAEVEAAHADAVKAVQEEQKKELAQKKKTTAAVVKPDPRHAADDATAAPCDKPVFGQKPGQPATSSAPSLFDAVTSAAPNKEPGPEQVRAQAPDDTAPAAQADAEPPSAPTDTEVPQLTLCDICGHPIRAEQQRHPLMPVPAHASAVDCEASRRHAAGHSQ